jgi:hypothetical protein
MPENLDATVMGGNPAGPSQVTEASMEFLDPVFHYSQAELENIMGFSDDVMWGGESILSALDPG